MSLDFFTSQLRMVAMGAIAYFAGKGTFTPADAGLATVIVTGLGPILVPYLFSLYSNLGTIKVATDSKAAAVAAVEAITSDKGAAIAAINATPQVAK